MTYGYQQINSTGIVQIDDTYQNLQLVQSGTGNMFTTVTFSTQARLPIIAIYCSTNVYFYLNDLTTSSFTVLCGPGGSPFTTFSYQIYGAAADPAPAGTGYGLRVYNSSGLLNFDSNNSVMAIKYIISGATISGLLPIYPGTIFSVDHNIGNPYVMCQLAPYTRVTDQGNYFDGMHDIIVWYLGYNTHYADTIYFNEVGEARNVPQGQGNNATPYPGLPIILGI